MRFFTGLIEFMAGLVRILSAVWIKPDGVKKNQAIKEVNDAVKKARKGDTEDLEDIINN
jgi:hypothetical protein